MYNTARTPSQDGTELPPSPPRGLETKVPTGICQDCGSMKEICPKQQICIACKINRQRGKDPQVSRSSVGEISAISELRVQQSTPQSLASFSRRASEQMHRSTRAQATPISLGQLKSELIALIKCLNPENKAISSFESLYTQYSQQEFKVERFKLDASIKGFLISLVGKVGLFDCLVHFYAQTRKIEVKLNESWRDIYFGIFSYFMRFCGILLRIIAEGAAVPSSKVCDLDMRNLSDIFFLNNRFCNSLSLCASIREANMCESIFSQKCYAYHIRMNQFLSRNVQSKVSQNITALAALTYQ